MKVKCSMVIFFILSFLTIFPIFCAAQIKVSEAEILLRKAECVDSLKPYSPEFIRSIRREDLEDRIFELQVADVRVPTKPIYIFEVSSSGIFVNSENEVVRVDSTGLQSRIIGVSRQNGSLFQLHGCSSSTEPFSELVRNTKIRIKSTSDAESFMYLYYILTVDPEMTRVVYNPRNISHGIEDFFFSEFSESEAENRFQAWKTRFDKRGAKPRLGIFATARPDGYEICLTHLELVRKSTPHVIRLELLVDDYGTIKSKSALTLY